MNKVILTLKNNEYRFVRCSCKHNVLSSYPSFHISINGGSCTRYACNNCKQDIFTEGDNGSKLLINEVDYEVISYDEAELYRKIVNKQPKRFMKTGIFINDKLDEMLEKING